MSAWRVGVQSSERPSGSISTKLFADSGSSASHPTVPPPQWWPSAKSAPSTTVEPAASGPLGLRPDPGAENAEGAARG
ncbi:MAG: hypothetical protein N2109_05550 [Fimbriimonadales bacterium]|nr:hypothetical protein [Fimbriimonadales bacterium]